jgi:GAF domain-containing protein
MDPPVADDVAPYEDWPSAVRNALAFLYRSVGMDVWMLTRVEGDRQIVLLAHPREAVPAGMSVAWDESFCRVMVTGAAPRVSTVTAATPAYAQRMAGPFENIAAYVGVPLMTRDGTVFGTLCGISARAQPRSLARNLPLVEMTARMLSTVLALTGPSALDVEPEPGSSAGGGQLL